MFGTTQPAQRFLFLSQLQGTNQIFGHFGALKVFRVPPAAETGPKMYRELGLSTLKLVACLVPEPFRRSAEKVSLTTNVDPSLRICSPMEVVVATIL